MLIQFTYVVSLIVFFFIYGGTFKQSYFSLCSVSYICINGTGGSLTSAKQEPFGFVRFNFLSPFRLGDSMEIDSINLAYTICPDALCPVTD